MEREIDPTTWYTERELKFTPKHFTVTKTPITLESRLWILQHLQGRYSILSQLGELTQYQPMMILGSMDDIPAFEDPKEAMMYELKWS